MAPVVFINYRGVDADYVPSLLYERLSRQFGARRVFLDDRTIAPGEDYVQRLLDGVRSAKVLLAVIGPRWFARDGAGGRLIDDPHDWIRRELVVAFASGVTVIPVFTEGATPPRPTELPADIAQLGRQHGLPLRRTRSGEDLEAIARKVAPHVPGRRHGYLLAAAVALLLLGLVVGLLSLPPSGSPNADPSPSTTAPVAQNPSTAHEPPPTTTTPTTTTPTTTTSTTPPAEVPLWWEGTLTLNGEAFQTGYTLDTSPPTRQPAGDIGLMCQLGCASNKIAGTHVVPWTGAGLPERHQCVDLLNTDLGQRTLTVKVGTKACFGTAEKRVGHLEVLAITGPGHLTIKVKTWDLPPR